MWPDSKYKNEIDLYIQLIYDELVFARFQLCPETGENVFPQFKNKER